MTELIHILKAHLNDFDLVASDLSEIPLQILNLSACLSRVVRERDLLKRLQLS